MSVLVCHLGACAAPTVEYGWREIHLQYLMGYCTTYRNPPVLDELCETVHVSRVLTQLHEVEEVVLVAVVGALGVELLHSIETSADKGENVTIRGDQWRTLRIRVVVE